MNDTIKTQNTPQERDGGTTIYTPKQNGVGTVVVYQDWLAINSGLL